MLAHSTARNIAIEIWKRLQPYCDRINIAGSIRRGVMEVKDIELVCQPKRVKTGQVDLFGVDTTDEVVHGEFTRIVNSLGKIIKGKPDGRYMQIEIHDLAKGVRSINLDLFMPQAHDYFRQLAIRTGSAQYSHKMLANSWLKIGWVGTEDGLRLETECIGSKALDGKTKWRCYVKPPTLPKVWTSEEDFFDWLGLQWIPPDIRYVTE